MFSVRETAVLGALVACAASCTDAFLQPRAAELDNLNDRLTLRGEVCTSRPDPNGFPVKVVFVIDQSGSMCVSDPPGAQESSGFCQRAEVAAIVPPGVTEPARVRALRQLVAQFASQPNVRLSIAPFETNVKNVWPPAASGERFARPNGSLDAYMSGLQSQLGKGTDYQGALAYAYGLIASDIADVSQTNPELLPRTRYMVVFLTDGTPFPRCSANDNLGTYADADAPELTWADSSGAGDFCNLVDPDSPDEITGFVQGTDRNQNYQLFTYVDQLMELKQQFNVGDVRFHSVLLFNVEAVRACGPICQDLYGTYPNTPPAQYPEAAKKIASWLLRQFAQRGNGVYQEFNDSEVYNLGLGALDYSSLASRNAMKTLIVQPLRSTPGTQTREVDSDGDGLPDTLDNPFTYQSNNFFADSDGDCFDDAFEAERLDQGFRLDQKDGRGCDPNSPLSLGCRCRDTDGDGLSQFAEDYVKTRAGLQDTDGDGVPDGLEVRYGLDPLTPDAARVDTDGDGITDAEEIRAGSNPTRRDVAFVQSQGIQYASEGEIQGDGRICYAFTASNLPLVTPPSASGVLRGYNLFKLYFAEAPESGVSTDYGVWKAACAWAQFDPPSVRDPLGPELTLDNSNFVNPSQLLDEADYRRRCVGTPP